MVDRTVLLIADAFHPNKLPPESLTNTYLALALAARQWNVAVWSHHGADLPVSSVGLRVLRGTRYWGLGEVLRISMWLFFNRPNQIIIMYHSSLYSARHEITWIPVIAKLLRLPCISLFTNGTRPERSAVQNRILSVLGVGKIAKHPLGPLSLSSKLVFYSEANQKNLLGPDDELGLGARSSIVSPPNTLPVGSACDKATIRASLGFGHEVFLVGYFGLIYPGKGIEWLLEAIEILVSQGIKIRLILIGPHGGLTSKENWNSKCRNYEAMLRKKVVALGLEDSVLWCGYCDDLTTVQYLSCCDVACLPFDAGLDNRRSSFIACAQIGLPIVTTKTNSTDQFLLSEQTGITYVKPRDSSQIAASLELLYRDKAMRAERAAKMKRFAMKHYRNDAFADLFDDQAIAERGDGSEEGQQRGRGSGGPSRVAQSRW